MNAVERRRVKCRLLIKTAIYPEFSQRLGLTIILNRSKEDLKNE